AAAKSGIRRIVDPPELRHILYPRACCDESFLLRSNIERTFTGEPRTLKNPDLLQLLVEYGFNRVTFGVESFNEEIRKQIGRWDSLQDVAAVFSGLEKVGYTGEKDLDLMFDLPGQTFEGFQSELDFMMKEFRPDE